MHERSVRISQQETIEQYVRDLGGGFLFAGGESGYGLGGWYHTTIERILPVRMDAEKRKDEPEVAMALVIELWLIVLKFEPLPRNVPLLTPEM